MDELTFIPAGLIWPAVFAFAGICWAFAYWLKD